ncbi:MAG TPA: GNAT family N-acetyltransferase [Chthoniobacterales bacterium]
MERRKEASERPLFATVAYAEAFGLGAIDVPEWQTALLKRPIPSADWSDALSCYPFTAFGECPDLIGGLERLRESGLVSVALVPDPLLSPSADLMRAAFEICRPFKTHYLIDREAGPVHFAKNHRWSVRQAQKRCSFEEIDLADNFEAWLALYRHTIIRHRITGIHNFAPAYFRALSKMPAVTALAARHAGEIIAIILWVRSGEIVYAHLEGGSPAAYRNYATYGLIAAASEHFADCRVIHLGGAAGVEENERNGLAHFKRGFANREVPAYFCGSRLDPVRYATLIGNQPPTSFFPAYRKS